jgi:hypothetical protein
MNRMSSLVILTFALSANAALADGSATKEKPLYTVSLACLIENSQGSGKCPRIAPKPQVTLVSADATKGKRARITQMPWMIGAFQ